VAAIFVQNFTSGLSQEQKMVDYLI